MFPKNIYTFVATDGENIHIDAEGLRLWCVANHPEEFLLPMNHALARTFLRDNVISPARCNELALRAHLGEKLAPIIMVKDGTLGSNGHPNVMLVDGHHRYYLHHVSRRKFILGHLLDLNQWLPFKIEGLPDVTAEQLKRVPVTKRNY